MFPVVSRNCETMFHLFFVYFLLNLKPSLRVFVPFIGISYILFKCRTFYSSFVPFFDRDARAFLKYLHSSILPCVQRSRPIVSLHPPSPLSSPTLSTLLTQIFPLLPLLHCNLSLSKSPTSPLYISTYVYLYLSLLSSFPSPFCPLILCPPTTLLSAPLSLPLNSVVSHAVPIRRLPSFLSLNTLSYT